jgi:prepilin-type processing-associated H-X9-DG protein
MPGFDPEFVPKGDLGTSMKAVFGLALGFISCLCVPGIFGLILSILGLTDISRSNGRLRGKELAIGGIVINSIGMVCALVLVPMMAVSSALLLPAVGAARDAAKRAQCSNNLKQIGLAMHNYMSMNDRFPAPAIVDEAGKPLLSWRVTILPFLGHQALYDQFHLDEGWDSPHNQSLIGNMPVFYSCPAAMPAAPGQTVYQVLVGPHTLFQGPQGATIPMITDGMSNTLLACEAAKAVPWTKPEDITVAEDGTVMGLGSRHPLGFNALFADGSVRFLKTNTPPETLKAMATRDGNEVVRPSTD